MYKYIYFRSARARDPFEESFTTLTASEQDSQSESDDDDVTIISQPGPTNVPIDETAV